MTTYDKIAHTLGLAGNALVIMAGAGVHLPGWLIILAGVVAFTTGVTTSPVMQKPTVGQAVEKAKIGIILILGGMLAFVSSCSCGHVGPFVDAVEDCGAPAVQDARHNLFPAVVAILECSGGSPAALPPCAIAGLEGLAASLGPSGLLFVDCMIDYIRSGRSVPGVDAPGALVRVRADEWMRRRQSAGLKLRSAP